MKKLLFFLFINLFTTCISAQENYTVYLTGHVEPTYSVKIPSSIDITNQQCSLTYEIKGDICANQTLNITFDSTTNISDGIRSIPVSISQNKTNFAYSELSDTYTAYSIDISHSKLPAGTYTGQLNVYISLITS